MIDCELKLDVPDETTTGVVQLVANLSSEASSSTRPLISALTDPTVSASAAKLVLLTVTDEFPSEELLRTKLGSVKSDSESPERDGLVLRLVLLDEGNERWGLTLTKLLDDNEEAAALLVVLRSMLSRRK